MKEFWRKKLPAFLMAWTLVVTLIPVASAASADVVYTVDPDERVFFNQNDFKSLYEETYQAFDYLVVTGVDNLDACGDLYGYDRSKKEDVYFKEADIGNKAFYYNSTDENDFLLGDLVFYVDDGVAGETVTMTFMLYGQNTTQRVSGRMEIQVKETERKEVELTYEVEAGGGVYFDEKDFEDAFEATYPNFQYLKFTAVDGLDASGELKVYDYFADRYVTLNETKLIDEKLYYRSENQRDFLLEDLIFYPNEDVADTVVTMKFTMYGEDEWMNGVLYIKIAQDDVDVANSNINYSVTSGNTADFKESDFKTFYGTQGSGTFHYVKFTNSQTIPNGILYSTQGSKQTTLSWDRLDGYTFYADGENRGSYENGYPLSSLNFVAGKNFDTAVVLKFRAYSSATRYVDGVLVIQPDTEPDKETENGTGDNTDTNTGNGTGTGTENKPGTDTGNGSGTGTEDKPGTGAGDGTGTGTENKPGTGTGDGTGSGTEDKPSTGTGDGTGTGTEDKPSTGTGDGTGTGTEDKPGTDTGDGNGTGTEDKPSTDAGDGTGSGTEDKPGTDTGDGSGTGTENKPGTDAGDGTGSGTEEKPGTGTGDGSGTGSEDKPGTDTGDGSGTGTEEKPGTGTGDGTGTGTEDKPSTDTGDGTGTGTENKPGTGTGDGSGTGSEDKPGTDTGDGSGTGTENKPGTGTEDGTDTEQPAKDTVDILYQTTYNTNVQINPNHIVKFYRNTYPNGVFQSVKLNGIPSAGSLYYNYYGVSSYGASGLKLTAENCDDNLLYFSPRAGQYALSELTYIPYSTNYSVSIPFTANGTEGSVDGNILISVTLKTVSEVYGATPRGTSVAFPTSAIVKAVSNATNTTLSGIQLLKLPEAHVGTVYVGTGMVKVKSDEQYGYSDNDATYSMNQLRFVPAAGYTGSVEIPYAAYNSEGEWFAVGKFSLGIVNRVKTFLDMTSSTWCYKYVTELSDAGIIDGYVDGTFKPNNTVTYGAALKLIMLAAGYPEQAPTGTHVFSGYLSKAREEGIITRTNVNLSGSITRLQVAQLAAGAMKLSVSNLSSVKPFTDTADVYVQALNAAGIVEGYFSNGTSTYKPGNTLTRGQLAAIVWRMYNYSA